MIRRLLFTIALIPALAVLPADAVAQQASTGTGAALRVLDKVTGAVTDVTLANGASEQLGYLRLALSECRYPLSNPSGDAYAAVTAWYRDDQTPFFMGWLIASSPALNPVDHPRYDVWVLRCTTS